VSEVIVDGERGKRLLREMTRGDFRVFLRRVFGTVSPGVELKWGWYLDCIADHLEAVEKGQISKLIINQPPRTTKSISASVAFPAWLIGHDPSAQVIGASYGADLSIKMNMDTRLVMESEWYRDAFPEVKLAADQNEKWRFQTTKRGHRTAVSVGGKVTGFGASCFVAGTMVGTPNGGKAIESLVVGDIVLTYNHKSGSVQPNPVEATSVRDARDIVRVQFDNGSEFRCTPDHQVFARGRGYIAAIDLQPGQEVIIQNQSSLQFLWGELNQRVRGCQEVFEERIQRFLLQQRVFCKTSCSKKFEAVQDVCQNGNKKPSVLWDGVQGEGKVCAGLQAATEENEALFGVWEEFLSSEFISKDVLNGMCEQPTLIEDVGANESELQRWARIQRFIQENEESNIREGSTQVPSVPESEKSGRASYRREYIKQLAVQFTDFVQSLSPRTSFGKVVSVSQVTNLSGESVSVYDIQTARNHNFFANEILVHNCIIIDDPETPDEALSDAVRKSTNSWIRQNLLTRFNDRNNQRAVVVQQRVHEGDTTGSLLEDGDWYHLKLPAEFTKKTYIENPLGKAGWTMEEGGLLNEDMLGKKVLDSEIIKLGEYGYSGQYMQDPAPAEGGLVKWDWFKKYEERPLGFDCIIHSWDTAIKTGATSDYSVCTIWGIRWDGFYLLEVVRKKLEYPALKAEVKRLYERDVPRYILVEDKASGQQLLQDYGAQIGVPMLGQKPESNKVVRLSVVTDVIETGKVWLPEDASWLETLREELRVFPNGKNDDQVDSISQFLGWAKKNFDRLIISDNVFRQSEDYIDNNWGLPDGAGRSSITGY